MLCYTGPHDYFNERYVRQWTNLANLERPFRTEFFDAFAAELRTLSSPRVLDLGSGPGFLAEHVLSRCDIGQYHLFDFSPYMLAGSRARLVNFSDRVGFHEGNFLRDGWWQALPGPFDAVVSLQAVHEVRDADRIPRLYRDLRSLLRDGGIALIADEVNIGDQKAKRLLSVSGHEAALSNAGFNMIRQVYVAGDLVMLSATASTSSV
jgi:SAM-dependent methyltransferase